MKYPLLRVLNCQCNSLYGVNIVVTKMSHSVKKLDTKYDVLALLINILLVDQCTVFLRLWSTF